MSKQVTAQSRNQKVLQRYLDILSSGDPEGLEEVLDEHYVQVIPQSREVIRGIGNWAEIMRNWPPGADQEHPQLLSKRVVPPEDHDIVTPAAGFFPSFSVIRIEGEGDTLTTYARVRYEDDSEWYVVIVTTLRNGKITKDILFSGAVFEPPEWRSQWTDVMSPDDERQLLGLRTD